MCQACAMHFINITSLNLITSRWVTGHRKVKSLWGAQINLRQWAAVRKGWHLGSPSPIRTGFFFLWFQMQGHAGKGADLMIEPGLLWVAHRLVSSLADPATCLREGPLGPGLDAWEGGGVHRMDAGGGRGGVSEMEPGDGPPSHWPLCHNRLPSLTDSYLLYFPWCSFADFWDISEHLVC